MTTNEEEVPIKENKKPKVFLWKGIGILFALFAVLVVIYLLYAVNMKFADVNHALNKIEQLTQNKIAELERNTELSQKNTNQSLETLKEEITKKNAFNQDEWTQSETRYLIKLANDKVQLENNVPAAILLLKMADKLVSEMKDGETLALRQAIAQDISSLQSVPVVDITGLYLRLTALSGKIDQLALINKPTMTQAKTNSETPTSWWQRGLHHTWEGLREVVVVRYNETGKLPLIPPDLQVYFYQNVQAVILEARWALLHGESTIYKNSLNEAITWIKEYAIQNTNTQSTMNELNELANMDIHPTVPAMSAYKEQTVS